MPWLPVKLRDARVWAQCDADGTLIEESGRVEIRYRLRDGKAYRAARRNLVPIEGAELLPDEAMGTAQPSESRKPNGRSKSKGARTGKAGDRVEVELPKPPNDAVIAYTDGACSGNPGPCGVGVVLVQDGRRQELSEYLGMGTNNIGELTAIARALEAVETADRPVWIFTDSRYAIGVLTQGWRAKANLTLITSLKERLRKLGEVHLVYVPGHAGVPLNERADALAREAIRQRASLDWASEHSLSE